MEIKEYLAETMITSHCNHESKPNSDIISTDFMATMKELVVNQPDIPISQHYQREQDKLVSQLGSIEIVADVLPQLITIQSGLTKHKLKFVPVVPETIEQIDIVNEWSKCLDGSRFLAYHQKDKNDPNKPPMIIFTSDLGLKILSKSIRWQSDGTF